MGHGRVACTIHRGLLCFFCGHRRAGGPCTVCGYAAVVERAYDSTRACPRERFVCFFSRAGISAHEHRGGIMDSWRYCWTQEFLLKKEKSHDSWKSCWTRESFFKERKKSRFRFLLATLGGVKRGETGAAFVGFRSGQAGYSMHPSIPSIPYWLWLSSARLLIIGSGRVGSARLSLTGLGWTGTFTCFVCARALAT